MSWLLVQFYNREVIAVKCSNLIGRNVVLILFQHQQLIYTDQAETL